MADLTLPDANSEFAQNVVVSNGMNKIKIHPIWFQKLMLLLNRTNQASFETNGRLTVTATSDTNLQFSYVGSDGVTRVADLALATP